MLYEDKDGNGVAIYVMKIHGLCAGNDGFFDPKKRDLAYKITIYDDGNNNIEQLNIII